MMNFPSNLPKTPGVYFFKNQEGKIIYVGKAKSLKDRVQSYFQSPSKLLPKTALMISSATDLEFIEVESEIDALLFEANLIRKLTPKFNINWKDGKAYPLIEITIKEKVPQVHFVRTEKNPKALYFGPYPTGSDLAALLRYLRKIFPFVSQNHQGSKPCLRFHLGLCPCPAVFNDNQARLKYIKSLRNLIDFLAGKRHTVQKRLTQEMKIASAKLEFEKAGLIKNKLDQFSFSTQFRTLPWEYEVNPNLMDDRRQLEIRDLESLLEVSPLNKIEGFDISNLSGKQATGAQVVFIDGRPEKSLYRRYKIRLKNAPNDFAMMSEMIKRRLKSEIPLPEVMVIDGGKGQLSAVTKILTKITNSDKNLSRSLPKVISLAKRLETIYTDDGQEIRLNESAPALHLLQRLRDESHRFSRKYHIFLRNKKMLSYNN